MTSTDLLDPLGVDGAADKITGDEAWLQALVAAEVALSRALVAADLAPEWMLGVAAALNDTSFLDLPALASAGRSGGNPVIPLVKSLQARAEGLHAGAGEYVHVGATSQDIVDTAAMLVSARTLEAVREHLLALGGGLAALAETHRHTPQAGRTLGQHASPTSFGFVVAGWLDAVSTLIERVTDARAGLAASLAGAVGTLSVLSQVAAERRPEHPSVDTVVSTYARELGLAAPRISWHSDRLPIVEVGSVLAAATGVAGSIGAAVAELSRTEIGELGEGLAEGQGGSSAMPHKRNPVGSVLIVAAARQTPGLLSTLYGSLLVEDQRAIGGWHAEWQTLRALQRHAISSVAAADALIGGLHVDAPRMRANLDLTHGLLYSERVSALLAERIGRARAFELVRQASAAVSASAPLSEVLDQQLAAEGFAHDDSVRAAVRGAFDPDSFVDQTSPAIDRVLARFAKVAATSPVKETLS
ncbi:MAG: hypothetical protein JWQ19_486 [Subtercola sp.]|nr:hypothetical protein [Subtercola sp.]